MYQPTANRIVVVVMKGNKLKAMDLTGSSGIYLLLLVIIYLLFVMTDESLPYSLSLVAINKSGEDT